MDTFRLKSTNEIMEQYLNRIHFKQLEIESIKLDITALYDAILHYINQLYIPVGQNDIHAALDYLADRSRKDSKKGYDILNTFIRIHILQKNDKKKYLKTIILCGYEEYAYGLVFEYNKTGFILTIPNPQNITTDNLLNADYGQYKLSYYCKNNQTQVIKSYNIKDIAEAFRQFVKQESMK